MGAHAYADTMLAHHAVHAWAACRHSVAARAVRLGFNVLMLDSDMLVLSNPYRWVQRCRRVCAALAESASVTAPRYLKQPPFGHHTIFIHAEGPWHLNCGAYYIQHARPVRSPHQVHAGSTCAAFHKQMLVLAFPAGGPCRLLHHRRFECLPVWLMLPCTLRGVLAAAQTQPRLPAFLHTCSCPSYASARR